MNWKLWVKGLAAAAIGGAATGLTQSVTTSGSVGSGTWVTAAAGALVTTLAYLAKSPLVAQAPRSLLTPAPTSTAAK